MLETTTATASTRAKENLENYFRSHDVKYVTDDVVYTHMGSGEIFNGKEAVRDMIDLFYHRAFDARADIKNYVITDSHAYLEANFRGRHIGEINGIAATNKLVNVPMTVAYDLENGLIKEARVYMMMNILQDQLNK